MYILKSINQALIRLRISSALLSTRLMMRSWYSVLELHTPLLCTTLNVVSETSTVSMRLPSMVADRIKGVCPLVIASHTMVHQFTFKLHFRHTLNDLYKNKVVGKHKSEELAFGLQIILFVLDQLLPALLRSFPFYLFFAFSDKSVMCLFKSVGQTYFGQWVSFPKCRSSLTRSHHMEASAI